MSSRLLPFLGVTAAAFLFLGLMYLVGSLETTSILTSSPSVDVNQILEQAYIASLSGIQKRMYMSLPLAAKSAWFGQWRKANPLSVEKAMARASANIASQASAIAMSVSKDVTGNTAANVAAQIIIDQAGRLNDADKQILYKVKEAAVEAAASAASASVGQPMHVVMSNVASSLDSRLGLSNATPAQQQVLGALKQALVQSISQIPVAMTPRQSAMIAANALSAPITMTNHDGSSVISINPIVRIGPGNEVIVDMSSTRKQGAAKLQSALDLSVRSGALPKSHVSSAMSGDNIKLSTVLSDFMSGKLANLKAASIGINLQTV